MIPQTCLLNAVRTVIRADSDPVRQALFANLKESHLRVRLVFAVHEAFKNTAASALLVSGYGLGVFVTVTAPRNRRPSLLAVARHVNATRQIARIAAWLEPGDCGQLNTRMTPFSPPLTFNLAILGGQAEADARRKRGASARQILLAGLEGESMSLDVRQFERREPVIGIFTPKAVSWETLAAVIADCRQYFLARRIVIRWHPSMLEPPRLSHRLSDMSGIVESPRTAKLADVARTCDWVIADENSSVHLPVLKLGIPSIAVKKLGRYPETRTDMYGFVRDGVVPPAVGSIRDVRPDTLAAFFSNGRAARFQQYGAAYARPPAAIETDVRAAIKRLRHHAAIGSIDA